MTKASWETLPEAKDGMEELIALSQVALTDPQKAVVRIARIRELCEAGRAKRPEGMPGYIYNEYRQGLGHERTAMDRFTQYFDTLDVHYRDQGITEVEKGTAHFLKAGKMMTDLADKV